MLESFMTVRPDFILDYIVGHHVAQYSVFLICSLWTAVFLFIYFVLVMFFIGKYGIDCPFGIFFHAFEIDTWKIG